MFGKKARIEELEVEVRTLTGERDTARAAYEEHFHLLGAARQKVRNLEGQVETLTEELERRATISQALADENRDQLYQLQLYKDLLKQLNINVKLPARKTR